MGYTVGRTDGAGRDSEFEAYARLLRQRGVNLGLLPRVPEPGTARRWLYVWPARDEAEAFLTELKSQTKDSNWEVMEVESPPSEGPLGPVIIQVGRRTNGLVLALHPLSRTMLETIESGRKVSPTPVSIHFETLDDFLRTHGTLDDLAREVLPEMTGLSLSQLESIGYALIEDDTDRTLVFVRPGDLVGV